MIDYVRLRWATLCSFKFNDLPEVGALPRLGSGRLRRRMIQSRGNKRFAAVDPICESHSVVPRAKKWGLSQNDLRFAT